MRDGAFYIARRMRKRERKWKRMNVSMASIVKIGTVEHAWARQRKPTSRWKWRRNRARLRVTPACHVVAVEVALHKIAETFATWPDNWTHKHHFGGPLGKQCSCGKCEHGNQYYLCGRCSEIGKAMQAIIPLAMPMIASYLFGLVRRDVQ